jgi:hypothetical protein
LRASATAFDPAHAPAGACKRRPLTLADQMAFLRSHLPKRNPRSIA